MTPVDDAVAAFYNRHPYPPPAADLERHRRRWRDPHRLRADHHLLRPAVPRREAAEAVLVAGCGTGQAARYAVRPDTHVTGIDVSSVSLNETRQLQLRYGLSNLELRQLPIERAGELGRQFDRIVCTGVLHHLADPDAGLRALREVLKPDGALHLMVYAPYGRAGVYLLQDYCRRLEVGDSPAELRELVAVLDRLPRHHPLAHLRSASGDFDDPHALADVLLNPRDRAYSVPQLFALLERGGMRFGRWYRQAPYLPVGDPARTPHSPRLSRLPMPEAYAAVELFRGTMARHSVIAYRDDAPHQAGGLDQPGGAAAVPLRLPDTLCLRERLPPGAAAVLINPGHAYPDLFLPIDADELGILRAINGRRTAGEIARQVRLDPPPVTAFLQRLWWYDQVVFDQSGGAP